MCGRYSLAIPKPEVLAQRFDAQPLDDVAARFNAAPGQALPVVTRNSPNALQWMTWGLIPFWAKDDKGRYSMINARAEGIESKPAFRKPLRSQRCLVPATGFYEWDKSVKPSVPYHFQVVDLDLFAFAGLYDEWQDRETGETRRTYTIITTAANDVVAPVHNRMPVILTPEAETLWLDPDETDPHHLLALLQPFPAERMRAYAVSTAVNNVRNDTPALIDPISQ